MNGKQILLDALQGKTTPRTPWVPFVGTHGAFLIQARADEYLKSADLLVKGAKKARELYQPDGLPIAFDLQMEAEVLGCELQWTHDGPPSVSSHPLAGDLNINKLPKFDLNAGRLPLVMEATRRLSAEMGNEVALYGLICGPFTLALHLMGNDIFLEMYDDEDGVKELMKYCAGICQKMSQAYIENGCDVIAVVDPMLSQISPEHFEEFVSEPLNLVFDAIHASQKIASLFVCGDATRNLQVMCETHCDNISIDENVDLAKLMTIAKTTGTSVGGNMKLTLVFLLGQPDDAHMDALRCLDIGQNSGFILSPGCDLPFNTPIANVVAAGKMALDDYAREAARSLQAAEMESFDDIILPDYSKEKHVIVDVVTLDSLSCAPCQYMVSAVQRAAQNSGLKNVVVREHKVKTREGIGMLVKLGLQNIPTTCIDGVAKFISIIPDQPTLIAALQEAGASKANQ
jgi:MtaA/CmuA family methyltransferase